VLKKAAFPAPTDEIHRKENSEESEMKGVAYTYVIVRRQSVIIEEEKANVEQKCRHTDQQRSIFVEDKAELHDSTEGVKQNEPDPHVDRRQ